MGRFVVGLTGASGVAYGCRVTQALLDEGCRVDLIVTEAALRVARYELGWGDGVSPDNPESIETAIRSFTEGGAVAGTTGAAAARSPAGTLVLYRNLDLGADLASGTAPVDGVAVVPCSMDTLSAVATGRSENLLERVADVALKERRRLVLVPRETPLSLVHLRNLVAVAEAGAIVLPAMPGFYHRPGTVVDMVDFVAGKVLRALGLAGELLQSWQGDS